VTLSGERVIRRWDWRGHRLSAAIIHAIDGPERPFVRRLRRAGDSVMPRGMPAACAGGIATPSESGWLRCGTLQEAG